MANIHTPLLPTFLPFEEEEHSNVQETEIPAGTLRFRLECIYYGLCATSSTILCVSELLFLTWRYGLKPSFIPLVLCMVLFTIVGAFGLYCWIWYKLNWRNIHARCIEFQELKLEAKREKCLEDANTLRRELSDARVISPSGSLLLKDEKSRIKFEAWRNHHKNMRYFEYRLREVRTIAREESYRRVMEDEGLEVSDRIGKSKELCIKEIIQMLQDI